MPGGTSGPGGAASCLSHGGIFDGASSVGSLVLARLSCANTIGAATQRCHKQKHTSFVELRGTRRWSAIGIQRWMIVHRILRIRIELLRFTLKILCSLRTVTAVNANKPRKARFMSLTQALASVATHQQTKSKHAERSQRTFCCFCSSSAISISFLRWFCPALSSRPFSSR
jgi:hypothetical protein